MLKRSPLFIRFPLTHVYVGTGGERDSIHAIATSGKPFRKRERVIPGHKYPDEMIGARGPGISDAKLPFHVNMRDYRQGIDFPSNLL